MSCLSCTPCLHNPGAWLTKYSMKTRERLNFPRMPLRAPNAASGWDTGFPLSNAGSPTNHLPRSSSPPILQYHSRTVQPRKTLDQLSYDQTYYVGFRADVTMSGWRSDTIFTHDSTAGQIATTSDPSVHESLNKVISHYFSTQYVAQYSTAWVSSVWIVDQLDSTPVRITVESPKVVLGIQPIRFQVSRS